MRLMSMGRARAAPPARRRQPCRRGTGGRSVLAPLLRSRARSRRWCRLARYRIPWTHKHRSPAAEVALTGAKAIVRSTSARSCGASQRAHRADPADGRDAPPPDVAEGDRHRRPRRTSLAGLPATPRSRGTPARTTGSCGRGRRLEVAGLPSRPRRAGRTGWQDYVVASGAMPFRALPEIPGISPSHFLGALGMTGSPPTWACSTSAGRRGGRDGRRLGRRRRGRLGGRTAAKIQGARVVGIAGGREKCALLTDEFGFDGAVDYKASDWQAQLTAATPDGIDVDFENVGGEIMDTVFGRLNVRARVGPVRADLRLQR
jgi:zinc-binding dehydrogenase